VKGGQNPPLTEGHCRPICVSPALPGKKARKKRSRLQKEGDANKKKEIWIINKRGSFPESLMEERLHRNSISGISGVNGFRRWGWVVGWGGGGGCSLGLGGGGLGWGSDWDFGGLECWGLGGGVGDIELLSWGRIWSLEGVSFLGSDGALENNAVKVGPGTGGGSFRLLSDSGKNLKKKEKKKVTLGKGGVEVKEGKLFKGLKREQTEGAKPPGRLQSDESGL